MKEKARAIFDSRATWAGLGVLFGGMFGEQAAQAVNALGLLVMAVI